MEMSVLVCEETLFVQCALNKGVYVWLSLVHSHDVTKYHTIAELPQCKVDNVVGAGISGFLLNLIIPLRAKCSDNFFALPS